MGLITLNGNRLTLNGNTISLGGPDAGTPTVFVGGRWRAVVELAQFAPDKPIGIWQGDRQVIGRFRANARTGIWRGVSLAAKWGKP